jgi:hypothetical protein
MCLRNVKKVCGSRLYPYDVSVCTERETSSPSRWWGKMVMGKCTLVPGGMMNMIIPIPLGKGKGFAAVAAVASVRKT